MVAGHDVTMYLENDLINQRQHKLKSGSVMKNIAPQYEIIEIEIFHTFSLNVNVT